MVDRPVFASVEEYSKRFTDVAYWRSYVELVCARHDLLPCRRLRAGLPGTHPVFVVDDRYVVKLFTDLFGGAHSFAVEVDLYSLLAATPRIPSPSLLAHGHLFPEDGGWSWPYIVGVAIPGTSLGEAADRVTFADKEALAAYLGQIARHLHALPLRRLRYLSPSWDAFLRLLHARRAACAAEYARGGNMLGRLIDEIDAYLPSIEALVDQTPPPHLLHGDLNEDHLLGHSSGGRWRPTGIIDFGDAKVGDPLYELVALHIGLFHCNKHLLRTFLSSYGDIGAITSERFADRAMRFTLLHEFTVLDSVFAEFPSARKAGSLRELAALLWDLEQPDLLKSERSPT
jgi:aminoglycoside phosphotransferase